MTDEAIEERAFLGGQLLALEMVVSMMLNRSGITASIIEAAEHQLDVMHDRDLPDDPVMRKRFLQRIKIAGMTLNKLRGDGRP